jgi:hypothetical protein
MKLNEIALLRLVNQQIVSSAFNSVAEITCWMGAIQAQDYAMSKWALGVRLPGSTDKTLELAIDSGDIIRTHVLRPTWHLVSSADIHWMLELSAPQIKSLSKSRDKELGLDETVFTRSNSIIEKALLDNRHLTREELVKLLVAAGFSNDNNRMSHLLMRAEIEGIISSGSTKAGKQTYAILHERVPKTKMLKRDEAAAELARRYFTSHGPATLNDFVWWSGLPVKECRQAIEDIKSGFAGETFDNETYWLSPETVAAEIEKNSIFLLPAFDEYLISYKNRTASLPFENHIRAVFINGVFRPVIVQNGQVIGIWKRTIKNDKVILETEYFGSPDKTIRKLVEKEFEKYVQFLEKR